MDKNFLFLLIGTIFVLNLQFDLQAQTIEQRLVIVQNDQTVGGNFRIQVQVKGTSLTAANTLGSATIDIQFNNIHLTYEGFSNWAFGFTQGYSRNATNNITSIRVSITGLGVNGNGGGDPPGFDIEDDYTSWVQLNFTIQSLTATSLTINNVTNAIGLFENHSNDPATGVINNQILTVPENIINVPLPVELTSFTATAGEDYIYLSWQTKSEVNNLGFNVEKRMNGSEWNTIGFVEGSGNSTSPKEYRFIDNNLFVGANKFQYRLKQTDTDGSFNYSDIVDVDILPAQYELSQNYPNPFNPTTTIRFSLPEKTDLKIDVYNMLGQLIETLAQGIYEAGYHKIKFNASSLASGFYLYRIESSEFTQVKKMVLIK
jgi:hypothetical protein